VSLFLNNINMSRQNEIDLTFPEQRLKKVLLLRKNLKIKNTQNSGYTNNTGDTSRDDHVSPMQNIKYV